MYKVGIMLMGKPGTSPSKVKQIILEVQAKTKLTNILQYMLEIQKIKDMNYSISIEKSGDPVSQQSTIAQILRHTKPINNVIRLFLYQLAEQVNVSSQKIVFKPTSQQVYAQQLSKQKSQKKKQNNVIRAKDNKKQQKQKQEQVKSGCCCC